MSRYLRRFRCKLDPRHGALQKSTGCHQRASFLLVFSRANHTSEYQSSGDSQSADEAEKFSKLSGEWWDLHGEFKALHTMNTVRIPFIRDCLIYEGYTESSSAAKPLEGLDILDVGCGGGILSEPLARLGAHVVGIDASEGAISAAISHRPKTLDNLQYLNALTEDLVTVGSLKFDAVIASEVLEHVSDQHSFIQNCCRLLKPRASLIVSTINRTFLSHALAVTAAENILKVVPAGTHDWSKLVTLEELTNYLSSSKLFMQKVHGILYNPLCNYWSFVDSTSMNYIVHATRNVEDGR